MGAETPLASGNGVTLKYLMLEIHNMMLEMYNNMWLKFNIRCLAELFGMKIRDEREVIKYGRCPMADR